MLQEDHRTSHAIPNPAEPHSPGPLAHVETSGGHGVTTIHVRGEIDLATAPMLERGLDGVNPSSWGRAVLVDMSAVTFLDCAGLSACLSLRSEAQRAAVAFSLVNVPGQVARVFALTGHAGLIREGSDEA